MCVCVCVCVCLCVYVHGWPYIYVCVCVCVTAECSMQCKISKLLGLPTPAIELCTYLGVLGLRIGIGHFLLYIIIIVTTCCTEKLSSMLLYMIYSHIMLYE